MDHFNFSSKLTFLYQNVRPIFAPQSNIRTARSKAWVCGRSLAGIAGSNPVGGMVVCLL
jgi:hypothetical protein